MMCDELTRHIKNLRFASEATMRASTDIDRHPLADTLAGRRHKTSSQFVNQSLD